MFDIHENFFPFRFLSLLILIIFYGIYFTKMFIQRSKGIKTNQIGSRKEKTLHKVEILMSIATYCVVLAEVLSIILGWKLIKINIIRIIGVCLGFLGDLIFLIAIVSMKDSWRAGISEKDKTNLICHGIYAISRNPAFLGFDLVYIGIALIYANPISIIFSLFAIVMLHLQILQEEKFMEETFKDEYLTYKGKVNRYIGKK